MLSDEINVVSCFFGSSSTTSFFLVSKGTPNSSTCDSSFFGSSLTSVASVITSAGFSSVTFFSSVKPATNSSTSDSATVTSFSTSLVSTFGVTVSTLASGEAVLTSAGLVLVFPFDFARPFSSCSISNSRVDILSRLSFL